MGLRLVPAKVRRTLLDLLKTEDKSKSGLIVRERLGPRSPKNQPLPRRFQVYSKNYFRKGTTFKILNPAECADDFVAVLKGF